MQPASPKEPPVSIHLADCEARLTRLGAATAGVGWLLTIGAIVGLWAIGHSPTVHDLAHPSEPLQWLLAPFGLMSLALRAYGRLRMRQALLEALTVEGRAFAYHGTFRDMARIGELSGAAHLALQILPMLARSNPSPLQLITGLDRPALNIFASFLGLRHRLQHTSFAGHRFDLHGPFRPYFVLCMRRLMWAIVSCGYLYAELAVRTRRMLYRRVSWAGHAVHYDGDENEVRPLYLKGAALCMFTLGAYLPWHLAALRNYHISKLRLAGVQFVSHQDGASLTRLMVSNGLLLFFGLGFFWGRIVARTSRYQLAHLTLRGALQPANPLTAVPAQPPSRNGTSDLLDVTVAFEF